MKRPAVVCAIDTTYIDDRLFMLSFFQVAIGDARAQIAVKDLPRSRAELDEASLCASRLPGSYEDEAASVIYTKVSGI